jgi:molybdate transport system substrate-binding protein
MPDHSYRSRTRSVHSQLLLLAAVFLLAPGLVLADRLRIAVASNFSSTMQTLASQFEQQSGHEIDLIFGSSGKLYAQIINGAPFDAFFSADVLRAEKLEQEGRIQPGSRFIYAYGQLVLWSPDPALIDPDLAVLSNPNFYHLAIANPRLAPYGLAAQQTLQKLTVWAPLQSYIVRGENIGQTYQFIQSGNAELGFVALSQLQSDDLKHGSYWQVPEDLYAPIEQQAVQLSAKPPVRDFMTYVQTPDSKSLIQQSGYRTP